MRLGFNSTHKGFARGVSLVELLVVLGLVGLVAAIAMPNLGEFLAKQRVRAASTELISILASTRAEAVQRHRRVVLERTGTTWVGGWKTYVDLDSSNSDTTGDLALTSFPGFGEGEGTYICSSTSEIADRIVFRGDGTVANVASGTEVFLRVENDSRRGSSNNHARNIVISPAGRASLQVLPYGTAKTCS